MLATGNTRTITTTSGKGGVGKTSVSVNLALCLAELGHGTCLFDADLGLANINILLGLNPEYTLEDLILNGHSLKDIIIRDHSGVDIIPGSSGVEKMADLDDRQVNRMIQSLSQLSAYDFLLFDTSAGVSKQVVAFCLASSEVVLIVTPEPTSLTDAYALLKILTLNGFKGTVRVIVNQCRSGEVARITYAKFQEAVHKYLNFDTAPLGFIIRDHKVVEAVANQQALVVQYPEAIASRCIKRIAMNLLRNQPEDLERLGMQSFWTKCFQTIQGPLKIDGCRKEQKGTEINVSEARRDDVDSQRPHESELIDEPESTTVPAVPLPISQKGGEDQSAPANVSSREEPIEKEVDPLGEEGLVQEAHSTSPLVEGLIQSVSAVAQELRLMRMAMEQRSPKNFSMSGFVHDGSQASAPEAIILDYDAFVKQHNIKESKENNE